MRWLVGGVIIICVALMTFDVMLLICCLNDLAYLCYNLTFVRLLSVTNVDNFVFFIFFIYKYIDEFSMDDICTSVVKIFDN